MGQHGRVAAESLGVRGGAAEDLAPPSGDMLAVRCADPAWEQGAEQVIALDPVIEAVDHPLDRRPPARPLVQRRNLAHDDTVTL
jgi:hypothetical protein